MMAKYKVNVEGLYFAKVKTDTDTELIFDAVEQVAEVQEVQISPKIAEGGLFGNGRKVHSTSKKTSYEIAVDMTVLPPQVRAYVEGLTVVSGVESGSSKDEPKAFALGFEIQKTDGKVQKIWFPYAKAKPIEESIKQSEESVNYSTDKLVITALEHKAVGRFYTKIDSEYNEVTTEMLENFFKKVQTTDTIEAN